jgi:uncharacterized damage-inducible protein DinB
MRKLPGLLFLALLPGLLAAQAPAGKQQDKQTPAFFGACSNLACEIEHDWSRNNVVLYGLANAVPEDKYSFKPTPAQQTFGERVLHAAQINLLLLQGLGAKTPAPTIDMQDSSKKAAMAALERVGFYGVAVIQELGDQGLEARIDAPGPTSFFMGPKVSRQRILSFLMAHSQDTYGQLVVYARLCGVTPPASRMP